MRRICEISDCAKFVKGYGLCENHLKKLRRGTLGTAGLSLRATKATDDYERFEFYVPDLPDDVCWPWGGALDSKGYGVVRVNYELLRAHRWVYEKTVGPIPEGLDLDHDCHNRDMSCLGGDTCEHRKCVNPAHLLPSTRKENLNRGNGAGGAKVTA